jgi:hypothetical protein
MISVTSKGGLFGSGASGDAGFTRDESLRSCRAGSLFARARLSKVPQAQRSAVARNRLSAAPAPQRSAGFRLRGPVLPRTLAAGAHTSPNRNDAATIGHVRFTSIVFSNGSRGSSVYRRLGMPVFSARSPALDGVSWVQVAWLKTQSGLLPVSWTPRLGVS